MYLACPTGNILMMVVVAVILVKCCKSHHKADSTEDECEQVAKHRQDYEKNEKCRDISEARQ